MVKDLEKILAENISWAFGVWFEIACDNAMVEKTLTNQWRGIWVIDDEK